MTLLEIVLVDCTHGFLKASFGSSSFFSFDSLLMVQWDERCSGVVVVALVAVVVVIV